MRKHEEKVFSGAAEPVHDAHAAANYGVCSGERFDGGINLLLGVS